MSRYIDADMLEKDGWNIHRTRQISSTEMVYETKKPTDFPAAEVEEVVLCVECIHWNAETKGCKRNPSVYRWYAKDFCSNGVR